MRTFQYSGAGSHKFWNIELTGNSFTVTYGKVGAKGQTQTKTFATDAEANAAAEKLIKEKVSKGYRETTASATESKSLREAMEEALRENPSDQATAMALADYLQEQNDPQGEFMQVQLALEDPGVTGEQRRQLQKREADLLGAHRAEWVGDWVGTVPELKYGGDGVAFPDPRPVAFERGILNRVIIEELTVACARAMAKAPQLRLVSRLHVGGTSYDDTYEPGPDLPEDLDEYDRPALHVLLRWPVLANLRVFQLGWNTEENYDDYCPHNCHLNGELAYDFVKQMPRLEELYLFAHNVDAKKLFKLDLPHLRILQLYHSRDYPLDVLAKNASMKNLTHLFCHPHALEYEEEPYIQLKHLRAVVRSPHLTSLQHLRLRCSTAGDRGCDEIIKSGILKRLRTLDLRHGGVTDAGARALAGCADLKNLESLDLSRNMLTQEGVAALETTGVSLNAIRQHTPAAVEDGEYDYENAEYLWEGDIE